MKVISENLGKIKQIREDEPLPINYIEEIIEPSVLSGRIIGLMAEISKRTDKPITFDDQILNEDNIMFHAFLRVAQVITKEEQRVLNALLDEQEWLQENIKTDSSNGMLRSLHFVKGWKLEANEIFEQGGNMYDLLVFSDRAFITENTNKTLIYGYRGKLPDSNFKIFSENGKKGLKDKDGNVVLEAEYDKIDSSGWSGRGWFLCKEDKWGAVNERLEWMFPMEYESIATRYEGGHYLKQNGKKTFCNEDGKLITHFIYDEIENYSSSWQGFKVKDNGKWGYIDNEGNELIPIIYDYISLCSGGNMIRVEKDSLYGYYNMSDNSIIDCQFEQAHDFYSSHPDEAEAKKNGLWGVINRKGDLVLAYEYDGINIESSNVYRVKKDGLEGIIDKDKKVIFPFKYKSLSPFNEDGIAVVQNTNGLYGYIDKNDQPVIDFKFAYARNFDGNYAEVAQDYRRVGVIDKTGKVVVPMNFDSVYIHSWDDVIVVEQDDRDNRRYVRGLYDLKTGNTLPCIYEHISPLGRDRDGILICRCKKYDETTEIEEKVLSKPDKAIIKVNNEERTFCIKYHEKANNDNITIVINDIFDKKNIDINRHSREIFEVKVKNSTLTIPEFINDKKVVGIASCSCWTDKSELKCVIFPVGLRYIGREAFKCHPTLETIIIQDGIRRIEDFAFSNCPNLKNVVLGKGILLFIPTTPLKGSCIRNHAFSDCSSELTFYIPSQFMEYEYDRIRFKRVLPREEYESAIMKQYTSIQTEVEISLSDSKIEK